MIATVAYYIVVIILFYFSYKLLNKKSQFSGQGLWTTYLPKWCWHKLAIAWWRWNSPKRVNNYNPDEMSYDRCGIVPTPEDGDLESPKTLITDRHEDGILLWGGDKEGRTVVAKLVRLSGRRASAFLMVKDNKGNIFTLPNQPDSNVVNISNEQSWRGGGLLLECVEPMRTWRLKFNGLLRKGTREEYITDDVDDDDDNYEAKGESEEQKDGRKSKGDIVHVRMDFLWKAMKHPVDMWRDTGSGLLAHALARERWADISAFKALDRDGYDQWGALHGTLKIGYAPTETWYLRGGRQHRWGMSDYATNLQVSVNLFVYFAGGDLLWLEGFSYNTGISHCVMGYVQTASGSFYPITSTSLDLSTLDSEKYTRMNICVDCKAGDKQFHLWNLLSEGVPFHTGDPWKLKHDVRPTHSSSTLHGDGWGLAFMSNRFNGLCPVPERESLSLPSLKDMTQKPLVIDLSDLNSSSAALTGGKGSSLACLKYIETQPNDNHDLQFTVPNGVVVTSHAWEKQIETSKELRGVISNLEKEITSCHVNRIREACVKVKQCIDSLDVDAEIVHCLAEELNAAFPDSLNEKRFAVRSSACGEDSSEASSAGQNETVLGCVWMKSDSSTTILRALITCWGSQFSFQSVEYRRQRGQPVNDGMAVVVQEMVPAKAAGVMFTRDPTTGSPASIFITANFGLGESVVSASAEPDSIEVSRTWRNKLKVKFKSVGEKKIKHIMKDSGGMDRVDVAMEDRKTICLLDDDVLRLASIGIHVEDYYGSPRDIEFALTEDGAIFLLQARPLTVLDEWTDYEIMHELDTCFASDEEISTIANTGEVLNGYICPLTHSTVVKILDLSIQRDLGRREWPHYSFDPHHQRNLITSHGTCFLNAAEICYRGNDAEISMVNKVVDLAIFGRLVTTLKIHKWAVQRFGVMTPLAKLIRTGYAFYDMVFNTRRVKQNKPIYSSYEIVTRRVTSASSLYKEICRKIQELLQICEVHCHTSAASTMTQCIAFVVLADGDGEIKAPIIQDMASILSCVSDTESATVPTSLKDLARTIANNEEVDDFLQMTSDEGRVWLESHPESVGEEFRYFLQTHGHRCVKEFDLRALSWGLAPEILVSTLQTMVRNPKSYTNSKENVDLEVVLDNLKTPLSKSKKRTLRFILKLCSNSLSLRESTKSLVIKTVDAFRKAYRVLGQVMVSECRLPDADLIFFLQHREIGILLQTRSARLVSKAIRRRKLMTQLESLDFPEISFGILQPINSETTECVSTGDSNDVIRGTPVCFGVTSGPVRVITSLHEASQIQNGDILVTFSTDIGWSPYFPLLAGVVTEIGGLISHGAVVAREYGLPCVVGAKGATKKFKSGDMALINGEEGFIMRISKSPTK